jgi:tetratricopeptide (TPR) repeat protein
VFQSRAILLLIIALAVISPAQARCRPHLRPEAREGRRLLLLRQWDAAADAFDKAVKRGHPSSAELLGLGYACFMAERYQGAACAYERLCKLKPHVLRYRINVGLAYGLQGQVERAQKEFERARQMRRDDPDVLHNYAVTLHDFGQLKEAFPLAKQAAAASPPRAYMLAELGEIYRDLGDYANSYRALQAALNRDRTWPSTYLGLAELFRALGRYPDAIHYGNEFLRRTEDTPRRWLKARGRAKGCVEESKRLQGAGPTEGEDSETPRITVLRHEQARADETDGLHPSALRGNWGQFGVLGIVEDDRAISQVRVNGAEAMILALKPEAVTEGRLQKRLVGIDKGRMVGKGLLLDQSVVPDSDLKLAADPVTQPASAHVARAVYVFHASLPLRLGSETVMHISAWDFAGHVASCDVPLPPPPPPLLASQGPMPKVWALFVGVKQYLHLPGWNTLLYPPQDAQRLYDVMCAHGGLDPRQTFLLDDDAQEAADWPTLVNIKRHFCELHTKVLSDDVVLFFYSGHGVDQGGRTYLLMQDSRLDRLNDTALDGQWLASELRSLPARRVVLFLDACHAAGLEGDTSEATPLSGEPYGRFLSDLRSNYCLFASCGAKQRSYEDLDLEAGIFGYYLAEGLAGSADAAKTGNGDGVVQLRELADYVEAAVDKRCGSSIPHDQDEELQRPVRLGLGWNEDLPLTFVSSGAGRDSAERAEPRDRLVLFSPATPRGMLVSDREERLFYADANGHYPRPDGKRRDSPCGGNGAFR